MTTALPTKREWARIVRECVLDALRAAGPTDLWGLQARVGYDIGATHQQVAYAVRVLSSDGDIMYDKRFGEYRRF